jgi:hypothetical protein
MASRLECAACAHWNLGCFVARRLRYGSRREPRQLHHRAAGATAEDALELIAEIVAADANDGVAMNRLGRARRSRSRRG